MQICLSIKKIMAKLATAIVWPQMWLVFCGFWFWLCHSLFDFAIVRTDQYMPYNFLKLWDIINSRNIYVVNFKIRKQLVEFGSCVFPLINWRYCSFVEGRVIVHFLFRHFFAGIPSALEFNQKINHNSFACS